jgi:hypothetical protein
MKAYATVHLDNGDVYSANLRGRGAVDIDSKILCLVRRLETKGLRAKRWYVTYGHTLARLEFITVRSNHVKGPVYKHVNSAPAVIRRFR